MAAPSRSRPKGPAATPKPQRRFQFIDNNDIGKPGANSTQVRRHVMQEYMREKRWENRSTTEAGILGIPDKNDAQTDNVEHRPTKRRRSPSQSCHANRASTTAAAAAAAQPASNSPARQGLHKASGSSDSPFHSSSVVHPKPSILPDAIEEISRDLSPYIALPQKHVLRDFYLTPQAFAKIADLLPIAPPTPPLSVSSAETGSPQTSSDGRLNRETNFTSPATIADPSSVLSAARTDPFDSLPMTLSRQDQELFDFYATVMPACSYGFERRSPHAHNWYLSVFIPEAMKSPVAFQNTILVHAANTQAWVKGVSETPLSIEHRARASEMLSTHFQKHPYDTSDAAISSTLSAAALEDFDPRVERRRYAWLHWRAAMQKIRDRGGPMALEQNVSLRMLINWSDYIFSGYDGNGSTFFFDHASSPQSTSSISLEDIGRKEIGQQCEELIIFLKCAEHLASVAANLQSNLLARQGQPLRYSAFTSSTPLHALLASPNGPRYTKSGQLKQIISRLAALLTINVAIWEYRYSVTASEAFFQELADNIYYNDLDKNISVEALLQILLSGSRNTDLRHTERPWLVGRLLKVAKRLSRSSWERLNDFLLQCLTLDATLVPPISDWEHELRAEILTAPLASEVLPLMKASS